VIVLEAGSVGLADVCPGPWPRLKARLAADRLDRELASGAAPESSVLLAVHAQRIVDPTACSTLARSVRKVIERAKGIERTGRRRPALSAQLPISTPSVSAVAGALRAVADRLDKAGPVRARGVAEVRALLRDGAGPLYGSGCIGILESRDRGDPSLRDRIDAALRHI
jgi:hypothetical protein